MLYKLSDMLYDFMVAFFIFVRVLAFFLCTVMVFWLLLLFIAVTGTFDLSYLNPLVWDEHVRMSAATAVSFMSLTLTVSKYYSYLKKILNNY